METHEDLLFNAVSTCHKACKAFLQALRSALYAAAGSEQLLESISAGLNWMDGEPKEGPDLVPSLQVRLHHALPAATMSTLLGCINVGDALLWCTASERPSPKLHDACGGRCRHCRAMPSITTGASREGYDTAAVHAGWQLCSVPGD